LKDYFLNFDFNEDNFQIFIKFNELIFHEGNEIQKSQWNEEPTFLCLEDYFYILTILKNIFPNQSINLFELINKYKSLIHDNDKFHKKNQQLKKQLSKL
jgi:hypothetical protein